MHSLLQELEVNPRSEQYSLVLIEAPVACLGLTSVDSCMNLSSTGTRAALASLTLRVAMFLRATELITHRGI